MQANMIKKQIENINDLQDVKLENVQFIRTGASEETLSFYALDDKGIIYYTDNGVLTNEEKASFNKTLSERFQWQTYYLGMGHYIKMRAKYYKCFMEKVEQSEHPYRESKGIMLDLMQNDYKELNDRTKTNIVKGVILGHAVADALGVPVEFMKREALDETPVEDMGVHPTIDLPRGSWSDDTSMSLCALISLAKGKIDFEEIMQNFGKWYYAGEFTPTGYTFDIGLICMDAIKRYYMGIEPIKCGGKEEYDNGNGSLMRINPFALYLYYKDISIEKKIEIIHKASALTHAHKRSKIGCGIYSFVLWGILDNPSKQGVINGLVNAIKFYKDEPELNHYIRCFDGIEKLKREEIKSSGYIVDTLEAALWCLLTTETYSECVRLAVNLGEDTDTVGAVVGGLAGALYGYSEIPFSWLNTLAKKEEIEKLCEKFAKIL